MPPIMSASRAVGRKFLRRNCSRQLTWFGKADEQLGDCVQIRCFSCIAGIDLPLSNKLIGAHIKERNYSLGRIWSGGVVQRRGFLGRGDGEQSNVLKRVYEERRVLGYSPDQLFSVVAAVDLYDSFIPWCHRSEIVRSYPDGSFDAELEIRFKFLIESYTSRVELNKPNSVKTTVSESSLFDHLINVWEFSPGPVPGSCNIYFLVDFKFQSPLYRQISSMFFKEVASRLFGSFNDRCHTMYGPGVPILQQEEDHSH